MKLRPNGKDYNSLWLFAIDYLKWENKTYDRTGDQFSDPSRFLFGIASMLQHWLKDRGEFK